MRQEETETPPLDVSCVLEISTPNLPSFFRNAIWVFYRLVLAFEISSLCGFAYDVVLKIREYFNTALSPVSVSPLGFHCFAVTRLFFHSC